MYIGFGKRPCDQPNGLLLSLKQSAGLAYLIFQLICESLRKVMYWHLVLITGLAANAGLVGKHSWELTIGEYNAHNLVVG